MIELHGIINEVESLRGFVSSGVDYYKGDKGDQGEKGDRGYVVFTYSDKTYTGNVFEMSKLVYPGFSSVSPRVGDLVLQRDNLYQMTVINPINNTVRTKLVAELKGEQGAPGERGLQGYIFTPSVSSSGVISWRDDGGLPNPSSVDLVNAVISALPSAVGVNF